MHTNSKILFVRASKSLNISDFHNTWINIKGKQMYNKLMALNTELEKREVPENTRYEGEPNNSREQIDSLLFDAAEANLHEVDLDGLEIENTPILYEAQTFSTFKDEEIAKYFGGDTTIAYAEKVWLTWETEGVSENEDNVVLFELPVDPENTSQEDLANIQHFFQTQLEQRLESE